MGFGETQMFKLCPPPYLVNLGTLFHLRLNLFWVDTPGCTTAEVRDIYRMEFEVFKSSEWCLFLYLRCHRLQHAHVPRLGKGSAGPVAGHPEALPQQGHPRGLRHDHLHRPDLRELPRLHTPLPHGPGCDQPRAGSALGVWGIVGGALYDQGHRPCVNELITLFCLLHVSVELIGRTCDALPHRTFCQRVRLVGCVCVLASDTSTVL